MRSSAFVGQLRRWTSSFLIVAKSSPRRVVEAVTPGVLEMETKVANLDIPLTPPKF